MDAINKNFYSNFDNESLAQGMDEKRLKIEIKRMFFKTN